MANRLLGMYGASGFGRGTMHWLEQYAAQQPDSPRIVFIDDYSIHTMLDGHPVMSYQKFLQQPEPDKWAVIAIADSKIRERIDRCLLNDEVNQLSLRGSFGVVRLNVRLGEGSFLGEYVSIDANVVTGRSFHCLGYGYVGHDCIVGNYVTFAPRVSCNGNVIIEDHVYIGSGAVIKQGRPGEPLVIGRGAVVGMGAVVTQSVPPGVTVVGNPARPLVKS